MTVFFKFNIFSKFSFILILISFLNLNLAHSDGGSTTVGSNNKDCSNPSFSILQGEPRNEMSLEQFEYFYKSEIESAENFINQLNRPSSSNEIKQLKGMDLLLPILEKIKNDTPKSERGFALLERTIKFELVSALQCKDYKTGKESPACFFIRNNQKIIGVVEQKLKFIERTSFAALLTHEIAHAYGADEETAKAFQRLYFVFRAVWSSPLSKTGQYLSQIRAFAGKILKTPSKEDKSYHKKSLGVQILNTDDFNDRKMIIERDNLKYAYRTYGLLRSFSEITSISRKLAIEAFLSGPKAFQNKVSQPTFDDPASSYLEQIIELDRRINNILIKWDMKLQDCFEDKKASCDKPQDEFREIITDDIIKELFDLLIL